MFYDFYTGSTDQVVSLVSEVAPASPISSHPDVGQGLIQTGVHRPKI